MLKKILLLSAFCFILNAANAQIVVYSTDVVSVGQTLLQANDSTPIVKPGSAGISQTWNYSGLHATTVDTITTVDPASTADGSQFPTSDLALIQKLTKDTIYTNNTTAAFRAQGVVSSFNGNNVVVHLNPPQTLLVFPATYLTHFADNYTTNIRQAITTIPGYDSVRVKAVLVGKDTIDAYGSMQTPLGTYNVIRVNEYQITADTIFLRSIFGTWSLAPISGNPRLDTNYHFSWYANSLGYQLVSMDSAKSGGAISNVQWLMSAPVPTSVNNYTAISNNVLVYPNPAKDEINFTVAGSTPSSVVIYDITGRTMITQSLTNSSTNTINTSSLKDGFYIYKLLDKNAVPFSEGKFSVIR
ncbi:MAG TPA: T9SS type A sorting domain-containing protein [Bacteroidia bacterium]|nr:T9SS type A sorting domain-containing protein [Bacteroidia bacterium]